MMGPNRITCKLNVKQCSLCPGFTAYYCNSCQKDLCQHCKTVHVIDLDTKHHEVTIYREKFKYMLNQEKCYIHRNKSFNRYCKPCEVPVCDFCSEHKPQRSFHPANTSPSGGCQHKLLPFKTSCLLKKMQHKEIIHNIRSDTLYVRNVLLKTVNDDFKTCHSKFTRCQSEMITRGHRLKDLIGIVPKNVINKSDVLVRHKQWCLKQKIRMVQYIARLRKYEQKYEQYTSKPVKFLRFIKKVCLAHIQDAHHFYQNCLFSLTQDIAMKDLIKFLSEIQILQREKRKANISLLLTTMSSPSFQQFLTVIDVNGCYHISCLTPDRVWVSDGDNTLILTDTTTGDTLFHIKDPSELGAGIHTISNEGELIYLDKRLNIQKLSSDLEKTTLIKTTDNEWVNLSVYCSQSSGDLLVGMQKNGEYIGRVTRYNCIGQIAQTIPQDNTPHTLIRFPCSITENQNGNIVVSDSILKAVVVFSREGRHRFSYTGPPTGSGLNPQGICTDALSHILVCDNVTHTVQMISKDGDFLSFILTEQSIGNGELDFKPNSLSYEVKSHSLWVGSLSNNNLLIYRYLNRHIALTGMFRTLSFFCFRDVKINNEYYTHGSWLVPGIENIF